MSGVIPLSACAIIVNDGDNVAVVKSELQGGEHVELPGLDLCKRTAKTKPFRGVRDEIP